MNGTALQSGVSFGIRADNVEHQELLTASPR
jgi:hypothetical protein